MTEKDRKQGEIELYILDTVHEHTTYDVIRSLAVDKETFKKYFPDWYYKNNSKPRLQPKKKRHD